MTKKEAEDHGKICPVQFVHPDAAKRPRLVESLALAEPGKEAVLKLLLVNGGTVAADGWIYLPNLSA